MSARQLQQEGHPASFGAAAHPAVPLALTPAEQRITDALLRCVARWGLSKTTVEDLAREAGVSRATVYRLFPGGKDAVLYVAVRAEVHRLLTELLAEALAAADLEQCLVDGVHHAAVFLGGHPALSFLRDHERAVLDQVVAFERLDVVLVAAGEALQPALARFLPAEDAHDAGVWCARLVLSYLAEPARDLDLCRRDDVVRLVRTFVLPGLSPPDPDGRPHT
ncbi:MAG: TetR/AcrR family transcriptional regulator [Microthrixaceae bacterium]